MKLSQHSYATLILGSLFVGFAFTQLSWHNYWAAAGFATAGVAFILLHLHAQFIQKLLLANHVMNRSMQQFMKELEEAGIVVTHVETDGDVETTTASVVRKGLH